MKLTPYARAFLRDTNTTWENFKTLDYMGWIEVKHREFQAKLDKPLCDVKSEEYDSKFLKFLNIER